MGKVNGRMRSNYVHKYNPPLDGLSIRPINVMSIGHAFLAVMALSLASIGAAYDFTANDCYLPKAQGGQGYCGPSQCQNIPTNTNSDCVNTGTTINYQAQVSC